MSLVARPLKPIERRPVSTSVGESTTGGNAAGGGSVMASGVAATVAPGVPCGLAAGVWPDAGVAASYLPDPSVSAISRSG